MAKVKDGIVLTGTPKKPETSQKIEKGYAPPPPPKKPVTEKKG
jgi:hypothetical protein